MTVGSKFVLYAAIDKNELLKKICLIISPLNEAYIKYKENRYN
jgi:hypothetical protein